MKTIVFLLLVVTGFFLFAPASNAPTQNQGTHGEWTKADSKAYARDQLSEWQEEQWSCLTRLWGKESAWNPDAYNTIKVMGKNAGGIPQLLGLDPATPPTRQIERGLAYIYYRYDTPCNAWAFFKTNNYH